MIEDRLEAMLNTASNLPSLPGVTLQIVKLTNDPDCSLEQLVATLQNDPALASKLLRVVNSPIYSRRGEIDTLRKAVVVLGLGATQSLALSFSLVGSLKNQGGQGLNYPLFWRRSMLAAMAARLIGEAVGERDVEALFLAALMQDLGMLVLDKLEPEFYQQLGEKQLDHPKLIVFERLKLGTDHADLGAWILKKWEFNERLIQAVEASHNPMTVVMGDEHARFARCVALSGLVADSLLQEQQAALKELADSAQRFLTLGAEQVNEIVQNLLKNIPAQESMFDTRLLDKEKLSMVSSMAIETLQRLGERNKVAE